MNSRAKNNQKIPASLERVINFVRQSHSQIHALEKTYDILSGKYRGNRLKTITHIPDLFGKHPAELWQRESGFMYCVNINKIIIFILTQSGWFMEDDIEKKWTTVYGISPHQYLSIRLKNKSRIDVDVWAEKFGIGFGKHATGFIRYEQ